jgi:exopolysaccharide biosynthesis polyprenyl glycosylphosphotransferase
VYEKLETARPPVVLRETLRQAVIGAAGLILVEYLARLDLSRSFLALFVAIACVVLSLVRLNARALSRPLRREFGRTHHAVIVGSGERAARIESLLSPAPSGSVRILAVIAERDASASLPGLLKRDVVDEVIFAVEPAGLAAMEDLFLTCDDQGIRTRVAIDFFPHVNSDMYLDRLHGAPLLTFSATPHDEIRLLVKRITDIVLAGTAMIVLLPFLALLAALIRLTSPGPALFRQIRCGLNGRRFVCLKFRSMVVDAESMKASLAHLNEKDTAFKIANDPRLTSIGRWLRKFSLDELPQFWNVLKGDMSLVGPRPAVPEEVEQYERWQRRRLRMRPGLTCLWALNGRDRLDFDTWMKLDMQYIDNWSLALDWEIMLRTVPQVLLGKGAH